MLLQAAVARPAPPPLPEAKDHPPRHQGCVYARRRCGDGGGGVPTPGRRVGADVVCVLLGACRCVDAGANILITRDHVVKIADFGLARRVPFVGADVKPTLTPGNRVVTLWYRAPELLLNEKSYDEKVDMWSAGAVFGELLAGSPIFPGRDETQLQTIISYVGTPTEKNWPGHDKLENYAILLKPMGFKPPQLVKKLKEKFPALN